MSDFKVLTDREHVLSRPGVYLGAVVSESQCGIINYSWKTVNVVPALLKMVEEIYQNSIDEHIRTNGQFANKIELSIKNVNGETVISVSDNGRGIPQETINGKPRPVLAWTELRAGSNFDDSKRVTAGTNGMGAALTNIFSKKFKGETSDGKTKLVLSCSDNMQNVKWKISESASVGTCVTFIPDLQRFGLNEFTEDHISVLHDRLINLAISYPSITFKFNGEKLHFKHIKQVAKQFHESSISYESENYGLIFAPSGEDEEFRCLTYVNGIYIKNGGAHIDFVLSKIIDNLRAHIKKKHKIDVLPNQIKQHLLLGAWCRNFNALKFDSQTKERITNSQGECSSYFGNIDLDKISKQILQTPAIIDPMIEAILFKKEKAEAAAAAKLAKNAKKVRVANHIAAQSKNPEERILILTEGLSAIGMLLNVRDPKIHGGYPLRGKVLNTRDMKPVEILKNKEISELVSIIGLEFGKKATNLNYGKIAIMTDSDTDGDAIRSLLMNFFSNWPELFDEGRIVQLCTPLYVCTKGKDQKLFYTKSDFDCFNSNGYVVEYLKGLGTMSKELYKKCITEPRMIQFKNDDNFDSLEMAFGKSAEKRKKWMLND